MSDTSADASSSPPPQSDQSPPASTGGDGPSSPPSPPQPGDSPSFLPPLFPDPTLSPPPSSPPPPAPADSNSPPPADSPPPSTPTPSSPPPQSSPPTPVLPPPTKSSPESSPPPNRPKKSPPPPSESSPSPPKDDSPSPPSPETSDQQPPPPSASEPPPDSPIPPSTSPSTPTTPSPTPPTQYAPPTTPDTNSSAPTMTPTPILSVSPPGSGSTSDSSSSPTSSSSSSSPPASSASTVQPGTVAGVALAGVFLVAFIALFFVCSSRRRRRKRSEAYAAGHYIPAGTISIKSEGYYPGQPQHNMNLSNSGPSDGFYPPQTPNSFANHSYGSQRGVANPGGGLETGLMGGPNPYFSYEDLMEITNGFSSQNVLGEGGFGCVYKGWLPDGKVVAVKQLKTGSGQGEREFKAEVEIISRVHHRHLVSLVGYCISEHHRLLVYEFVSNQTLEHHLHGVGMPVLDWTKRLRIALGAAKGLAYLHEDCHPKIIHRDIKSANILLEDSFEAQVADFGLAKPSNDMHTHVSTRVMGTFGYMAPEYASSGKLTDRSDVFSFGVVLLELITGHKPVDPTRPLGDESLVEWARPLLINALETGDLSELVDPRLGKHYVESEMMRMVEAAAACVRHSAPKRPRMVQVARALDCEGEMSDLSNGVKYGKSTVYDSGQYNQDIMKFRKMALGDSSEYDMYSGEFGNNSREFPRNQNSWRPTDGSSSESETRAFHAPGEQRYGGRQF